MELKVEEMQALQPIKFNYEEIKQQLAEQLKKYEDVVYTEETISLAKTDRATLNKVKKAINDEKIRIKNYILEDYMTNFEPKCKELMEMIEKVSEKIDIQVKGFEQKVKNEKLQEIMKYWIDNVGEYNDLIDFDLVFEERWLNATYSMSKVETDIKHIFEKTKMDLNTIDTTVADPIINKQVKDYYFKNINNSSVLSLAIQESKRIEDSNKKLDTLEKAQEEINNPQTEEQNADNVSNNEELKQLDFRVWVNKEQMAKLKAFLKDNNIKFGRVE